MGRIRVRKVKGNIPKLSLQTKYMDKSEEYEKLEKNELRVLITNKKVELKYVKTEENLLRLRTEIKLLEDLYKVHCDEGLDKFNEFREEGKESFFTTDLSVEAKCILTRMGYKTPIYTEECIAIAGRIKDTDILDDIRQIVALAIVKEILVHYGANFDEKATLALYDMDEVKFYDCYFTIHKWCERNYWRN